jgi:RNA polymerase sigma factor (sigma-70 family)
MHDDLSVADLVIQAMTGDKRAWDALVERYAPLVWSICRQYRLSAADAADVGQSVWVRLIEQLPALREPAALPGWLVTTARRECLRLLRAAQQQQRLAHPADPDDAADQHAATVEQGLLRAERDAALRDAFAELPARCRQLLSLLLHEPPIPYVDISARLGIPIGSIGPNRARCLERLRRSPALAALIRADAGSRGGGEGRDQPVVER